MLNTIMAVWNQNSSANRQRIGKVLFTILFIAVSASLFLFTFNSSPWSPFAGAQEQRAGRQGQPTSSSARGIVIVGNTPMGASGTVGITPTFTVTASAAQSSCVQIPAVVAQQRAITSSQHVVTSSGQGSPQKMFGKQRHVHSKGVLMKGKRHSATLPTAKTSITSMSPTSRPAPIVAPILPSVIPTIQPIPVPTVTASTLITSPPDGTPVSNLPAIVNAGATPGMSMNSTTQFTSSVQQKEAVRDPDVPQANSSKKSTPALMCGKSTNHGG